MPRVQPTIAAQALPRTAGAAAIRPRMAILTTLEARTSEGAVLGFAFGPRLQHCQLNRALLKTGQDIYGADLTSRRVLLAVIGAEQATP